MPILTGQKAICGHVRRDWRTVLEWVVERGFPATKLNNVWQSDSEMIAEWIRRQILQDVDKRLK
jgi:hypothetical protein